MINSKNIIVTGATGFVGRHIISNLLKKGYSVTALVRDVEKAKTINSLINTNLISFDISDKNKKIELPCDSVLIHCAWGDVKDTQSSKHIEEHFLNHYFFLKNIVEQGVKKILVTGSCYEYGLQHGPVFASTPTKPNTPYAFAKDYLHQSLRFLQSHLSFELIWARLFYMYGEGQDPKSIIPLFDTALENGDKVFNMSFGEQLFDYLPIEDIAKQIESLIHKNDGVFNVCSGKPISLRRLLEQRMKEKNKNIDLNLGYYPYRKQDSIAIWGADPLLD